jgi:hypothetical protein
VSPQRCHKVSRNSIVASPVSYSLSITSDAVTLFGHELLAIRDSASFRQTFGPPSRQRDIKMHPSGTRIAMVWDDLGMVAYDDRPEGIMSHLYLALDPSVTPEQPLHASKVVVDVNGSSLTADTTERRLPSGGATPIIASFGRRYFIETATYVLGFTFDRRIDARGRKTGTRRLAMISFSWQPSTGPTPR